ncbi:DUF4432 family protein [bacterium]|nr:DUF4432 family protein [bacterium]
MRKLFVARSALALLCTVCSLALSLEAQEVDPVLIDDVSVEHEKLLFPHLHRPDFEQTFDDVPYRIRKQTLHGGKQEGVELLIVDNGAMTITLVLTRGMNILEVVASDIRLGWNSPVKEVVHPQFINLESRGGLGWLEGFNEWMVRCGLEFAGHPGMDKFTTNTGDTAEMMLTLHGKIGNIPASKVEIVVEEHPPFRLKIRGQVAERMFYGPKLRLDSELVLWPDSTTFQIRDAVTNDGAFPQEFQLIYHGNYGAPLLGGGSRIHAAAKQIAPMNAHAAKSIDRWSTYAPPTKGFIEEVYLFEPLADLNGHSLVLLTNPQGTVATSVAWSTKELPYLTLWKNTADERDGYVTGIEPATGYPYNRSVERRSGRLQKLLPQETRTFTLQFGIHTDAESIAAQKKIVTRLQGQTKPRLLTYPLEDLSESNSDK